MDTIKSYWLNRVNGSILDRSSVRLEPVAANWCRPPILKFALPVNPLILCYGVRPAIQADKKANRQPMTNN